MRNTILKRTLALFLVFVLAFTSLNLDWNLQTVSADTESSTENTTVAAPATDVSAYYFDESSNVFKSTANDAIVSVYYTNSNGTTITLTEECTVYYVLTGSQTSEYYKSEYDAYVDIDKDTTIKDSTGATKTADAAGRLVYNAYEDSEIDYGTADIPIFDVNTDKAYFLYGTTEEPNYSDYELTGYWKELDLWRINGNDTEPIENSTFINSSSNYRLVGDIELQSSLIISSNTNTNIDLNGYVVSFAETYQGATVEGTIFYVKGTLNIYDSRANDVAATHYWNGDDILDHDGTNDDTDNSIATADKIANSIYSFTGGAITGGATSKIMNNSNVGTVYGGGGIFVLSSGTVNMYAGTIIGNKTKTTNSYGGGVYVWNGGVFNMSGGEISYNSSASIGGGVYSDGEFNMEGGVIKNNTATYGAGIYADGEVSDDDAKVTISGGTISANTATYGAGIYVAGMVVMDGGSVTGNKADTGTGGGAYLKDGSFTVSGAAKITGNTAIDGVTNNVNIPNNSMTITVAGELTGEIGVIRQSGTGTVATYPDDYDATVSNDTSVSYLTKITSDNTSYYRLINEDGTVELISVQPIEGNDITVTYDAKLIDIANLTDTDGAFFAESDMLDGITDSDDDGEDVTIADAVITYSVTPTTGAGSFDTSNNTLDVSSAGKFIVSVYVEKTDSSPAKYGTATLTVTPAKITLTSISAINRAYDSSNFYVELDQSVYDGKDNTAGYQITGVLANDDVVLDFSSSYGYITSTSYSTDTFTDKQEYAITVHGLALTGADSGNYVLEVPDTLTSKVTINTAISYIAWPAATDIIYGQAQSDSALSGGKVVVKTTSGGYIDITSYGTFKWYNASVSIQNVGSYSHAVWFVIDTDKVADLEKLLGNDYTNVTAALESQIHYVSYDVQAAAVSFEISNNVFARSENSLDIKYTATSEVLVKNSAYDDDNTQPEYINQTVSVATDATNETDATAGYKITYFYYNADGVLTYVDIGEIARTTAETYYIGAEFVNADGSTNYNYHHSGSADSTAKQIGALYIQTLTKQHQTNLILTHTKSHSQAILAPMLASTQLPMIKTSLFCQRLMTMIISVGNMRTLFMTLAVDLPLLKM